MHVLIVGANGLVGQGSLKMALQSPRVSLITTLTRRDLATSGSKVRAFTVPDFSDEALAQFDLTGIDACFYCAGVMPLGIPEHRYREVTVDVTIRVAKAYGKANPQGRFLYVSGAGADPSSKWMPMRIKGQAEHSLREVLPTSVFLRPGVVCPSQGVRSPYPARQLAYAVGSPFLAAAARLAPSMLTTTDMLGRALIAKADPRSPPGVVENEDINWLGR